MRRLPRVLRVGSQITPGGEMEMTVLAPHLTYSALLAVIPTTC